MKVIFTSQDGVGQLFLEYNCFPGPVGCTETVIEGLGTEINCHCDTNDCDPTVQGAKYDAGILAPDTAELQESGSSRTGSMSMLMVLMTVTVAYLNVK